MHAGTSNHTAVHVYRSATARISHCTINANAQDAIALQARGSGTVVRMHFCAVRCSTPNKQIRHQGSQSVRLTVQHACRDGAVGVYRAATAHISHCSLDAMHAAIALRAQGSGTAVHFCTGTVSCANKLTNIQWG
jgi:hypothetical protein